MRTALSLPAGLLLTALLGACAADPAPSASRTPTPTATAAPTATTTPLPSPTASPTATTPPATAAPAPSAAAASRVRLTGDGIDLAGGVVGFGATYEQARPSLDAGLGRPTTDTGVTDSFGPYGTCPGTRLRALEYGGGALVVLFGDVAGPALTMYQWALTSEGDAARVPRASALVGDAATYEFGVGTTVRDLQEGARPAQVEISPGDQVFSATFRVQDQSAGFFGFLTGTGPGDSATFVQGGRGCGE